MYLIAARQGRGNGGYAEVSEIFVAYKIIFSWDVFIEKHIKPYFRYATAIWLLQTSIGKNF